MSDKTYPKDRLLLPHIPYYFRRFSVKDKDLSSPPGGEAEGDRYIVKSPGADAWVDHSNELAEYHKVGAADITWVFLEPFIGFKCYVEDETTDYEWNGTSWAKVMTSQLTYVAEYGCYVVS